MNLSKNDIIQLKITSATSQGSGVGKTADGIAVFVPMSAPQDLLDVRILKVKKNYAYGKIEKIIEPSPFRIKDDCESYRKCGGCSWRHISYDEELDIKYNQVKDAITRIGGISENVMQPIIKNDNINRYRNKAQFPIGLDKDGNIKIGFYSFHSHNIVNCDDCLLQPESFNIIIDVIKRFINLTNETVFNEATHKGKLRHLYIRHAEITNETMVCLVVNGNGLEKEDLLVKMLTDELSSISTIIINSNREKTNVVLGKKNRVIYGRGYITDVLCGLKFKISPFSFWQVNRNQAEKLYSKAKECANLNKNDVLLDLYCGTGTIGLTMSDECKTLVGVEIIEDAVKDAIENAKINNIQNAKFICSDASNAVKKLELEKLSPNVVILDPPRKGCDTQLLDTVSNMQPQKIVYVSCDPATLARDLKYLSNKNYQTLSVTPCDMFSRTTHVESVVLMSRV